MEERELIDKLVDKSIEINRQEKEINELQLSLEDYRTMYLKLNHNVVKAIEYINNELLSYGDEWHWDDGSIRDYVCNLLDILKGKDN